MNDETKLAASEIYWRLGRTHLAAILAINLVGCRTIFSKGKDMTFGGVVAKREVRYEEDPLDPTRNVGKRYDLRTVFERRGCQVCLSLKNKMVLPVGHQDRDEMAYVCENVWSHHSASSQQF